MGLLDIGLSGLLAQKNALDTTAHNIANVNNEDYSRQLSDFKTRQPQTSGSYSIGSGVKIADITRSFSQFVNLELQQTISTYEQQQVFHTQASRLDNLLADGDSGITQSLNDFFSALQNLSDTPAYEPARQNFLSEAGLLLQKMNLIDTQINDQYYLLNQDLKNIVSQLNQISNGIAEINGRIAGQGSPSPDLLDQRDQLIRELSKYVKVSTIEQSDGAINVFIGSGQNLVMGGQVNELVTVDGVGDTRRLDVGVKSNSGAIIGITDNITGGQLRGLLDFRDNVLQTAQNSLGRIAMAMSSTLNAQHNLGMDLNGNLGGDVFTDINAAGITATRVLSDAANAGTANLSVSISNLNQLTDSDYRLTVLAGPNYSLTRLTDGTTSVSAGFPITVDGFTVNLDSGAAAVGDVFVLTPTRNGVRDINLELMSTSVLALASPIRTQGSSANTGTGAISPGVVTDTTTTAFTTTAGQLTPPIRIEFLSPTTYQLVNVTTSGVIEGPIAYNPAISNVVFPTPGAYDPGFRVELNGAPVTGDQFTINYNSGGVGDNRNALALSGLQAAKTMLNSSSSYQDAYANLVAKTGIDTHEAEINAQVYNKLLTQVQARRDNISGVNLDEEAANMLRFQQAYQGSAQIIAIAREMFNTIISTFSR